MFKKSISRRALSVFIALALSIGALAAMILPASAADDRIEAAAAVIAEAVDSYADTIYLTDFELTPTELASAVETVVYDHHELFFLAQSWLYYSTSAGTVTRMLPQYRYDVADIPEMREEYVNLLNAFITSCNINADDSEYERALAVHDAMCASFRYDTDCVIDCSYELLLYGEGVCEALTILYKAVLTHFGVECDWVINADEQHCWNVVNLDGEWYHVDVTWDDPVTRGGGVNPHTYFLLNDTELAALNAESGGHTSWSPAISATGTKYQNATLAKHETSMLKYGNKWYSLDKGECVIGIYDVSDFSYEVFYDIDEIWLDLDDPSYYWMTAQTGFALYNSRLYFNTPTAVMSIGIDGRDVRTEIAPALSGTNIYGFDLILGSITYYYGTSPNEAQTAVTVPVPTYDRPQAPEHFVLDSADGVQLFTDACVLSFDALTSVAEILALFPDEGITVYDAEGNALTSGTVSTGCTVTSSIDGESADVTVSVVGDVNGDGAVDSADTLALSEGLIGGLDAAAANAADLNRDGAPTSSDLLYAVVILKR